MGMGRGIDRESGFYEFYQVFFIREFYWILNCLLNVIFKIRTLILAAKLIALLHSHRNTQKSGSNQCYSESELTTAHCSHSTVVSTQFTTWMFSSLITKHINNRQKNPVHVIGIPVHVVTATVDKTPLCKIWKSADAKKVILWTQTMCMALSFTGFY